MAKKPEGQNVYELAGYKAVNGNGKKVNKPLVEAVVTREHLRTKSELLQFESHRKSFASKAARANEKLQAMLDRLGVTVKEAYRKVSKGRRLLVWSFVFGAANVSLLYLSLLPTWSHMKLWIIPMAIALGIFSILAFKVVFSLIGKQVSDKSMRSMLAGLAISVAVLGLLFGASFVHSRGLAVELKAQELKLETGEALDPEVIEKMDKIERKIQKSNNLGLLFAFLASELLAGIMAYTGAHTIEKYKPVLDLSEEAGAANARLENCEHQIAMLKAQDFNSIKRQVYRGAFAAVNEQNSPLPKIALVAILSTLIVIIVSSLAFGADCRSIVFCDDVTRESEDYNLQNRRAIIDGLRQAQANDRVAIISITDRSWEKPEVPVKATMPANPVWSNIDLIKKRLSVINEYKAYLETIENGRPRTDIVGAIYLAAEKLRYSPCGEKLLIIYSDMQQNTKYMSVNAMIHEEKKVLARLRIDGMMPDLTGVKVYVMGVTTEGLSIGDWGRLKEFWEDFFKETNAQLQCYRLDRSINLKK